ncbi:MAG: radical SAM protein, partial [Candidatus Hadarchaeota archaeon]
MSFDVVRPFDPWRSELCTCPPKYSFNPYTGCAHGCLYCYATYIPHFHNLRMKKDLLKRLDSDLRKLPEKQLIFLIQKMADLL